MLPAVDFTELYTHQSVVDGPRAEGMQRARAAGPLAKMCVYYTYTSSVSRKYAFLGD